MKARLIMVDDKVQILCANGTIGNTSYTSLAHFFTHFNEPNIFSGTDGHWNQEYADMSEYPGETLAYVTDNGRLLVEDPRVMEKVITSSAPEKINYITAAEYAAKHGRSRELIKAFLRDGRIPGSFKVGRQWLVPEDAPYPVEEVSRKPDSGRYPRQH